MFSSNNNIGKSANWLYTGKNDLTRRVTHREAVFGTVTHSIFDAWHYGVLWTYGVIRLLWYACDFVRWILYITLHTTNLKASCQMNFIACSQVRSEAHSWLHSIDTSSLLDCTLPITLDGHTPSLLDLRSQVRSQDAPKDTPSMLPSTLPGMLSRTHPIALDGTLPACLTVHSQVSSQDAVQHTPEHALKYTPNSTRWHTPSLLDYTLPSKLSRCSQVHSEYAPKYTSKYVLKYTPGHAL